MSKINSPTFVNNVQKDAYRFIFEEESIKEDYQLGDTVFKEVEWEYDDRFHRIVVRCSEKGRKELIIPFCLGSFPMLISLLKSISGKKEEDNE